jgi:phosphoribosylanthranilate isomerase
MTPRTRIKICGITRIEGGVAAARAGADAIGLVFWPGSPRAVGVGQARAIVAALPPFVTVVGLFVDPTHTELDAILAAVPLGMLQFHGHETPQTCRAFGRPYLKAIPVPPGADAASLLEYAADYGDAAGLLFDAPPMAGLPGGTGRSFDWARLPPRLPRPLVLSGGLDAANVGAAIRQVRPWAVDVSSGVEAVGADGRPRKGIKDPAKVAAFIAEVCNADVRPT